MDNQNQANPSTSPPSTDENQQSPRPAFQTIEQPADDSSPFTPMTSVNNTQANGLPPTTVINETSGQPPVKIEETADDGDSDTKKFSKNTIFAGIIGLLILIGGLIGGILLVRQPQDIREKAAPGNDCTQAADCILKEDPGNQGTFSTSEPIKYVDITAKDYHSYYPGESNDGCYKVSIAGKNLSWERLRFDSDCKDISNIQIWLGQEESTPSPSPTASPTASPENSPTASPTASPSSSASPTASAIASPTASAIGTPITTVSARCSEIKVYDEEWIQLSSEELSQLSSGDIIRLSVIGETDSGSFDKARFTVNGIQRAEVKQQKPGTTEFYDEYVIPEETVDFEVDAEVHHVELNQWF